MPATPTAATVRRRLGSFILALAVVAIQLGPVVAAEITTDLWVYQYGDTVTVTGVDFGPDEAVEIVTTDPFAVEVDRGTAQTDIYGGFTYSFTLLSDVLGIYDVVATGLTSGLTAATQFDPAAESFTFTNPAATAQYSDIVTFSGTFVCSVTFGGVSGCTDRSAANANQLTIQIQIDPIGGGFVATTVKTISGIDVDYNTGAAGNSCPQPASGGSPAAVCTIPWSYTWQAGRDAALASVSPGTYNVRAVIGGNNLPGTNGYSSALTVTKEGTSIQYLGATSGIEGTSLLMSADVNDLDGGAGAGNGVFSPDANLASTTDSTDGVRYQIWTDPGCTGASAAGPADDGVDGSGGATGENLTLPTAGTYYLKTTYLGNTYYSGSSDCDTITVNPADAAAPSVTFSFPAPDGNNGWFITDPVNGTVNASDTSTGGSAITAINCTDSLSGISLGSLSASGTTGSRSISVSGEGTHNISCTATDAAGNTTNPAATATVKIDTIDPSVTVTAARPADFGGWYNAPVTFDTAGTDATSGVSDGNCTADQNYTGPDGDPLTVSGSCTDNAGNVGNGTSAAFKFDDTNPSVTVTPDRSPDQNGWYNAPVSFDTAGTDATSGVADANCTANQVYGTPDGTGMTVLGSCTDNAGNQGDGTSAAFDFDNTDPTNVQFTDGGLTDGGSYYFGFVPAGPTACSADDLPSPPQSGFDACTVTGPTNPPGDAVGAHTYTATASDIAGNQAEAYLSYTVLAWTLTGFYQPVDMRTTSNPDVFNVVKGGSTVPLKFEVFAGPTELTDPAVVDSFSVRRVNCESEADEAPLDFVTTGGTSLRYDTTAGQFIQNWKTPRAPGFCYVVTMTTDDGSSLAAYFKLK